MAVSDNYGPARGGQTLCGRLYAARGALKGGSTILIVSRASHSTCHPERFPVKDLHLFIALDLS